MRGEAAVRVHVPLPRGAVYGMLADPELWPAWIRDLREVVREAPRRSHWIMHGPFGSLHWEIEQTVDRAPDALAWCLRSPAGSGFMRAELEAIEGRGTRVTIRRFVGFRTRIGAMQDWWGDPAKRLQGDATHFVELLRRHSAGLSEPGPPAVGFQPLASSA